MLGEERLVEPGHRLGPGQVRPGDEPAEAPIARGVAGEQHQVRTALPLADPADVLLDRLPMAGEPVARRPRPVRLALASGRFLAGRPPSTAAALRAGPVDAPG